MQQTPPKLNEEQLNILKEIVEANNDATLKFLTVFEIVLGCLVFIAPLASNPGSLDTWGTAGGLGSLQLSRILYSFCSKWRRFTRWQYLYYLQSQCEPRGI